MFFDLRIYASALLLLTFFTANACSIGSKKLAPMKVYQAVDIPNGEFLHYGFYSGGEKSSDYYFVTIKVTNGMGDFIYRTYQDMISVSSAKKPVKNYISWPVYYDIDPQVGSVIESAGNLNADDLKDWPKAPSGEVFLSWHYKLNREKGYVEYSSKMLNDKKTNESKSVIRFNTDFPSSDQWGGSTLIRLFDLRSGGIYYNITALFMKEPMPLTVKYISTETVQTKAGSFRTSKINIVAGDPFLGKLLEPMMKTSGYWIEDSSRRLLVKDEMAGAGVILEEISNVNIK